MHESRSDCLVVLEKKKNKIQLYNGVKEGAKRKPLNFNQPLAVTFSHFVIKKKNFWNIVRALFKN